jgi:2,4-dienoyl-CoA reductase-like NADH-dependent reductase (Old Yellow Enzyme family)
MRTPGKPPIDAAYADRPLIDHFAALPRGATRLGVAGKIMDAATAQRCLEHGADFVLIGRGAMLHHDFAALALADPAFRCVERPVTRAWPAPTHSTSRPRSSPRLAFGHPAPCAAH